MITSTLTSLKSVLWSVPSLSGRRNYFRKVALYVWRSLRGGTLFRTLPGRSLHGGDAFFRGKTPKIAEKLRISAIFCVFCGKINFSCPQLKEHLWRSLRGKHAKSVRNALYVRRSSGRSLQKIRYIACVFPIQFRDFFLHSLFEKF